MNKRLLTYLLHTHSTTH